MAEATQKTGTPRRGGSRAGRATAAKPAASKAQAAVQVAATVNDEGVVLNLIAMGATRQFSKWSPPDNSGCVGTFYAPLGATAVQVTISGPLPTPGPSDG